MGSQWWLRNPQLLRCSLVDYRDVHPPVLWKTFGRVRMCLVGDLRIQWRLASIPPNTTFFHDDFEHSFWWKHEIVQFQTNTSIIQSPAFNFKQSWFSNQHEPTTANSNQPTPTSTKHHKHHKQHKQHKNQPQLTTPPAAPAMLGDFVDGNPLALGDGWSRHGHRCFLLVICCWPRYDQHTTINIELWTYSKKPTALLKKMVYGCLLIDNMAIKFAINCYKRSSNQLLLNESSQPASCISNSRGCGWKFRFGVLGSVGKPEALGSSSGCWHVMGYLQHKHPANETSVGVATSDLAKVHLRKWWNAIRKKHYIDVTRSLL